MSVNDIPNAIADEDEHHQQLFDFDSDESLLVDPFFIDFDLLERIRGEGGVIPDENHNNIHNDPPPQINNNHDISQSDEEIINSGSSLSSFSQPSRDSQQQKNDAVSPSSQSQSNNLQHDQVDDNKSSGVYGDMDTNPSSHKKIRRDVDITHSKVMETLLPMFSLESWATIYDVIGNGNCLFYSVILALHCLHHKKFYLRDVSVNERISHLQLMLLDVTTFRKELYTTFVDNMMHFISHDPNVRKVHNVEGDIVTSYTSSYANNLIGKDSIGHQLYREGIDYMRGCTVDSWGDILHHIPIISYAYEVSIITYYYKTSNTDGSTHQVQRHCTLFAEYNEGSITVHELDGCWYRPSSDQTRYAALLFHRNHFQFVHPNDSDVVLPSDIGMSFYQQFHAKMEVCVPSEIVSHKLSCKTRSKMVRTLTSDEERIVQQALYGSGQADEVLAKYKNDWVLRESMETLRPGTWVNDVVINYYLKVCLAIRDKELCAKNPNRKRSHFFNSFFMQALFDDKNDDPELRGIYNYERVKRWSKKVPGGDMFKLKYIFCPINLDNMHWTSICVFMELKIIEYFDSMGGDGSHKLKGMMQYLVDEWRVLTGLELDVGEWKLQSCRANTPKQKNGYDCGMYTCLFANEIANDCRPAFTQSDVTQSRKHIALSIMQGVADELFVEQIEKNSNTYDADDDDDSLSSEDCSFLKDDDNDKLHHSGDGCENECDNHGKCKPSWSLKNEELMKEPETAESDVSTEIGGEMNDVDTEAAWNNEMVDEGVEEGVEDEQQTDELAWNNEMVDEGVEDEQQTDELLDRSFHHHRHIMKPSTSHLQHVSQSLGGKGRMSSYEHFICTEMIDGETYHRYTHFDGATYSKTLPGMSLAGKIVASHDKDQLVNVVFCPSFTERGPWFVDAMVNARDFPSHIALRCQNSTILKRDGHKVRRGKKPTHPFKVVFNGWCYGRNGKSDHVKCTTRWVGGIDYDNLLSFAKDPVNSTITISMIISGHCIHKTNEMLGQLRGPARTRCIDHARNSRMKPKESAINYLSNMTRKRYMTNNHSGVASSPKKMYNIKREAKTANRERKGIVSGPNEDINNIWRVQKMTSEDDLNNRKSCGDKSEVLPGVARLIEIVPDVNVWIHSRRMLYLAGRLSSMGRLVMNIDGTGGLLNFRGAQHDGKIQHVHLNVQLSECVLDQQTAEKYGRNVTNVVTIAERIGSRNTASEFEKWLRQVALDTELAMQSYVGNKNAVPLRPLIVKMDCALELLTGCLKAFRTDDHVMNAQGYNSIVVLVMLWREGMESVVSVTGRCSVAKEALDTILRGTPCIFKQCKVHVMRAIQLWPKTTKKRNSEMRIWDTQFHWLFQWVANEVVNNGSVSELIVRLCVVITILSSEFIPCRVFSRKSPVEDCHAPDQSKQVAAEMDRVMKEEVRKLQISSKDELTERLSNAFEKHNCDESKFDGVDLAESVLDRMMGRLPGTTPLPFSVAYLNKVDGKKGKLKVTYILSPYSRKGNGDEFLSARLLGGCCVDITLPYKRHVVKNPMYSMVAAKYVRYWVNRIGLWCPAIIDTVNAAVDASVFSCNQSAEGFIQGMKHQVTTVNEDTSSIADLLHRRYYDGIGMGRLVSNQIDQLNKVVGGRRHRVAGRGSSVDSRTTRFSRKVESSMKWKKTPGTVREHLKHYKELVMRGVEHGSENGHFEYNSKVARTIWEILDEHAKSKEMMFMSAFVFRNFYNDTRIVELKKCWCDVIDDFYNTYGR